MTQQIAVDIVTGWTRELGPFTLKADDLPLDLTGMTVVPVIRTVTDELIQVTGSLRVHADVTTGKVYFTPAVTDFPAAGLYSLRFMVTDSNGTTAAFPNAEGKLVQVRAAL